MKVLYLAEHNPDNLDAMSGTSHWIAKGLQNEGVDLQTRHITVPEKLLPPLAELKIRAKNYWAKFYQRAHYDPIYAVRRALYIGERMSQVLSKRECDVILTALTPLSGAYLESRVPMVYWTDSTYAGLIASYSVHRFHHPDTMWDMHTITDACLTNAKLLIFSSSWAARTAIECHGIDKKKIRIVPFGANLTVSHSLSDVKTMIAKRSTDCIKLLFVGKEWYRKGGDIVLNVAKHLHENGHRIDVTLVGATPKHPLPSYVKVLPFVSKNNPAGLQQLQKLYEESHFLFVPSLAEAFGIVFCEANAFGVPCITTYVGGIPDVVKDGINGMTFSLEATIKDYCDYIVNLFANRREYEALALSAFNEYQTRLNWGSACRQVREHLKELV